MTVVTFGYRRADGRGRVHLVDADGRFVCGSGRLGLEDDWPMVVFEPSTDPGRRCSGCLLRFWSRSKGPHD